MREWQSQAHVKWYWRYHVVIVPKYRRKSMFGAIRREVGEIFKELCRELGLVKLGTLGLDGTKVKANASKHKAMSYGRMKEQEQKLKQEIEALLEHVRSIDAREDVQFGVDQGDEDLPMELQSLDQYIGLAVKPVLGSQGCASPHKRHPGEFSIFMKLSDKQCAGVQQLAIAVSIIWVKATMGDFGITAKVVIEVFLGKQDCTPRSSTARAVVESTDNVGARWIRGGLESGMARRGAGNPHASLVSRDAAVIGTIFEDSPSTCDLLYFNDGMAVGGELYVCLLSYDRCSPGRPRKH